MNDCITIVKMFENNSVNIYSEKQGNKIKYYFKAIDIAKIIGIVNIRTSIQKYIESEEVVIRVSLDTSDRNQNIIFLTSQGVYRLLFNSTKPLAHTFRKWASDILDKILSDEKNELQIKFDNMEIEFKFLQIKLNAELKEKEDNKNWLHFVSKEQVSFKKFINKTDSVYVGSSKFEHQNYIEKIGTTNNVKNRETTLGAGNAPSNAFSVRNTYNLYSGMGLVTEKYIHAQLKPLRIISSKSTEHFMCHSTFINKIISNTVNLQNENILEINNYIDLLKDNDFNYSSIDSEIN